MIESTDLSGMYDLVPPGHTGDWVAVLTRRINDPETVDWCSWQKDNWTHPLTKKGHLGSPLVETTPFVFSNRLYRLENWQKHWEIPSRNLEAHYLEDEVRIRDIEEDEVVSIPLIGYTFSSAFVWENKVYIFAGNHHTALAWRKVTELVMTCSSDLVNWSEPKTVLRALPGEHFFNVGICRGPDKFILLYETDDSSWPPFTFRYCQSDDLCNWQLLQEAVYGKEKYVGGPALYYENNYYYTLYLEALDNAWETRITRSKDLVHWEDAPLERPFITYDPTIKNMPLCKPEVHECNASDVELCYWQGKTIIYFTGGNQLFGGDLQLAEFDGTPAELLELYFAEPELPLPSPKQQTYQNRQLGAFVHYGPATYTGNSDMLITPEAGVFNPDKLDVEQWVLAAKSFGAEYIVLTAKHHNGFCLWPTETTDYSVKSCPWKNGTGDIIREFVDAANKHGIAPGVYFSLGDMHQGCHSTPEPMGERRAVGDREKLLTLVKSQLTELLSNYGVLSTVWFDGAYDPFGYDVLDSNGVPLGFDAGNEIAELVHKLQPEAVMHGGTQPDIRWAGSEQGWAPYPLLNMICSENSPTWVPPRTTGWVPVEADLHTRKVWFWMPDSDASLRTPEELMDNYYQTIGRGANLLINITPDTSGTVLPCEIETLKKFGENLNDFFSSPIASISSGDQWQEGYVLELNLDREETIAHIIIEEQISAGQKIQEYVIQINNGNQWETVVQGLTVGRKKIDQFPNIKTKAIRLKIIKTLPLPQIKLFSIFK